MDRIDTIVSILDYTLETDRKKHIAGGILISLALLFAGLAITTITLNVSDDRQN